MLGQLRCTDAVHWRGRFLRPTAEQWRNTFLQASPTTSTLNNRALTLQNFQGSAIRRQPDSTRLHSSSTLSLSGLEAALDSIQAQIGQLSSVSQVAAAPPRVVVITGPSGVGKDAVLLKLKEMRSDLHYIVTATSRSMRPGEVDGIDYHFVSKQQFEAWIADGKLLEYALVYGEWKGIPLHSVQRALQQGKDVVLRIDVQGAATVRQLLSNVVSIFLTAESEAALARRLLRRKTETLEDMVTRVVTARQEMTRVGECDYMVVNKDGNLQECAHRISAIIDAERSRVHKGPSIF